jgi:3-oxoacyl-[acyl-carrier protein] reductase
MLHSRTTAKENNSLSKSRYSDFRSSLEEIKGAIIDLELKNKSAIVTGAARARGIGRAIALSLAKEGVRVACADLRAQDAESVSREIRAMGVESMSLGVDQTDHQQVKNGVEAITKVLGPIDILINSAGVNTVGFVSKLEPVSWDTTVKINLSGPYYWVREVFDSMAERNWGRIITIASIAGVMGGAGQASYAASKGGLISLTKTVALEGARSGITANSISPGIVATDMLTEIRDDMQERLTKRVAMRRPGDPKEIADLATFLASERAGYITGTNIMVDGGLGLFVF